MSATIVREEQCSGVVLTAKVVKKNEFEHDLLKAMDGQIANVRLEQLEGEDLKILGLKVRTKPVAFWSESARCTDPMEFAERYRNAKEDETVPMSLECDVCKFSFEENIQENRLTVIREGNSFIFPTVPC